MNEITIWGVRGSFPEMSPQFCKYGGNTCSVSAETDSSIIVFDAGTGMHNLGNKIANEHIKKPIHILVSHFHMDHLLGFFSFMPFYDKEQEIHIYGDAPDLKATLDALVGPPYWPFTVAEMGARVFFHHLNSNDEISPSAGIKISALSVSHPGGGQIYSMQTGGKKLVYALDCEIALTDLTDFIKDADLVLCDNGNLPSEREAHAGWGHSDWQQWEEIIDGSGVRRAIMLHYGFTQTDEIIDRQKIEAKICEFATEGMKITL